MWEHCSRKRCRKVFETVVLTLEATWITEAHNDAVRCAPNLALVQLGTSCDQRVNHRHVSVLCCCNQWCAAVVELEWDPHAHNLK
jgi:hypothetical protein